MGAIPCGCNSTSAKFNIYQLINNASENIDEKLLRYIVNSCQLNNRHFLANPNHSFLLLYCIKYRRLYIISHNTFYAQ